MNNSDELGVNEAVRLMHSLADATMISTWHSKDDKALFIRCWFELSRMSDITGDILFPKVHEALSHSFFACANYFVDDLDEDWEVLFEEAEHLCALLQADLPRWDVCEYVLRIARDHVLNLASDESTTLYFNGWDHLVWKKGDRSSFPDSESADAVIAAHAAMFVSVAGSLPMSSRPDLRELLCDVIRDLYTTAPNFDDNGTMSLEEILRTRHETTEKVAKPMRKTSDKRASKVTQECSLSPPDPRRDTYELIIKNRELAIRDNNKIQSKPYYSNDGANYLAEAVARAWHCAPIPEGKSVPEWFRQSPDNVVIVDACKIVLNVKDSLAKAPQAAVRGRLLHMYNYFMNVEFVNLKRLQLEELVSFTGEKIDPRYAVVLYRTHDANPRYRAYAERNDRK